MIVYFKYILILSLTLSSNGKKKEKRDLSDMKDDLLLRTVFSSDTKEKRTDRSISLAEELLHSKNDKTRSEQLSNILFPNKQQRRDSELMTLNKEIKPDAHVKKSVIPVPLNNYQRMSNQRTANYIPTVSVATNNVQNFPGHTNANIDINEHVTVVNPAVVVPQAARLQAPMHEQNLMEQAAVNPALFAANYLPLPGESSQQRNTEVTKKDDIPHPSAKFNVPRNNVEAKESMIPIPITTTIADTPSTESFPVQLRIHSPNTNLRGIVPHVAEYGETVESVRQAQKILNYKKRNIPQPPYKNQLSYFNQPSYKNQLSYFNQPKYNIVRKDVIPQSPSAQVSPKTKRLQKKSKVPKVKKVKDQVVSKKTKKPSKTSKTSSKQQRQYIPQYPYQQSFLQYAPYIANYQQQNPFSIQQSVLQYKMPPNTAQVQRMDGLVTRPILSDEPCADQYATCTDFAKNSYCTSYPELMKIQCRKSCGHCAPAAAPVMAPQAINVTSIQAKDETPDERSGSGDTGNEVESGSGSSNTQAAAVVDNKVVLVGDRRHDILQERFQNQSSDAESGSGASSEIESGNSESGSGESGSSLNTDESAPDVATKIPSSDSRRDQIWHPKVIPKIDLGDFTLPTKKSNIFMPTLDTTVTSDSDDSDDSGSGSGSADDSEDESGSESGDATAGEASDATAGETTDTTTATEKKGVTPHKSIVTHHQVKPTKKKNVPAKPSIPGPYPKIDLRAIAAALAHYEQAALELAGEYPKPAQVDMTEYTRSFIPHPVNDGQARINKYKQNIQIAKILTEERVKKFDIPKFLKLSKDALKVKEEAEANKADADSLDSVRERFIVPGIEPTLNDYYAETGKINPFEKKEKSYKKSKIENVRRKEQNILEDPYEYLRNMAPGASMEPIIDPKTRSTIPSDHSYPIFLMKVSPGDRKYVPEPASRRGLIRKLDAEGLPVSDKQKKPIVDPRPAKIIPSAYRPQTLEVPDEPLSLFRKQPQVPFQPPVELEPTEAQEQGFIQPPPTMYNIEQASAPRASVAFTNEEAVTPNHQPGMNSLRSKMLSAFFSVKNGEDAVDEGSGGGGSGGGMLKGDTNESFMAEGSGASEMGSRKSISLHNLLFNDNPLQDSEDGVKVSVASGKAVNLRKTQSPQVQDSSANYLQSNLAALTPENGKPSFEAQSGLTSGRLGAQFTMSKMSKTQETNWMRPNAESELASVMPESSSTVESSSHAVPSVENSAFQQPMKPHPPSYAEAPSLRNTVPKVPIIKKKEEQIMGSSKTIIPASIFSRKTQIEPRKDFRNKIAEKKLLSKDLFSSNSEKTVFPNIAITALKDNIDKSVLTDFPKSPFTAKSKIQLTQAPKVPLIQTPSHRNTFSRPFTSTLYNNVAIPRNNIVSKQPASYSWRQYVSFENAGRQTPNVVDTKGSQYSRANNVNNEQASALSARVGAARYVIATPQQPAVISQTSHGQYAGWDYILPPPASVQPLAVTTIETNNVAKFKAPVRKNLIKQQPGLDCGDNWEGAQGDFGTFCYKEMNMKASFDDALAECRRLKGDLFSVLNAYENRYLQDNIHEKFWIGYRDKGMDGNWNWTDSSKSIYTNWGSEPDDDNGQRHDCVYIDSEEGQWKDESCSRKQPYLCKKKAEVCPKEWKNLKLNSVNGCYKLFNDSKSWEDSEQGCQQEGAHLASITCEDEQTMVYQVHSSKSFWIGFNDRESEGDWQWSDRGTSSYTNWAEKSPNNGGVSCTSMVEGGKWHDEPCTEKLKFVCKRKGPKPEKVEGLDDAGILLPVARLLTNSETAPSHVYDDLSKNGPRPAVPIYFWPLLKTSRSGMAGNRPMAAHGDVRIVPGGIALDGMHSFLDGGDFHGKCISAPDKCQKGFAIAIQVFFDTSIQQYKKPHYVVDTSGGGKGFSISVSENKLNYKVIAIEETWELKTDLTVGTWQEIVMAWHKNKGIYVYVNGAFKDAENVGKKSEVENNGTNRLIIGRGNKDNVCTKMVIGSVAIFTKLLSVEAVPYAFTYGDTVVASYRWLMSGLQDNIIPGAPDIDVRKTITDVDGGIYIDGTKGWLQIDDFDPILSDISKAKHGFALSFKVKFDQRVRDYKEPKYILDTGGHNGGVQGISVYIVNDNLYFQAISSPDEDVMIWKVRVPIYTVRWQRVVMTWRLDKGLWVYLDGAFRGYTKIPITLPQQLKDTPKRFLIGRKTTGPDYAGAQFAFGSLGVYSRYLPRQGAETVFGGVDSPFPGIIREVWKNTPGEDIASLKANPDYPNNPTTIEIIENFDAPFNVDNDYGSKLKGYFIAPETGNITFYLSCSKSCELSFSAEEDARNKTDIISLSKPTWHNQWNKYENQSSKEIFLVAGKYYFLEAIHKGVDASDSLSVGVRMPTGRYQRPISKENLQWRLPGNQHAGLIREVWYDVPGYTIADVTSNANFPNRPSSTEVLDKFDAPFNVDDNYGSRISGYFHAPETGDYRFYLATDSSGELWISSDDGESNLVKVITLNGWTEHNQWLKYSEQKSDKVFMVAGRYYFIRVYMKADKLGDCASVAVQLPSGHFEGPIKKKHLSWKLVGAKDGPGPKEILEPLPKPAGVFALNDASIKDILLPGENKLILGDVDLTSGPLGLKDNAFLFKGNRSSYIEIPNDGKLDTRYSITMLAHIYPTGDGGPIINYKKDGWGVHLWQFSKTQLFVRFVSRDGGMTKEPLGIRLLELNKWAQVGASYDNQSGVAQLWQDGKMVKSRNIGQIELLTNAPIRLGAREGDDRCFKGKISCVQIYDRALKEEQVGELRHCPKKDKSSQTSENDELTVFTQGSGESPTLEEADSVENRIGDDTEEELIVQGEKNKATRCDPNPCKNNGVCQDDDKKIDGFVCSCTNDFTGKHCQVSKPAAENPVVKRTEIPKSYEKKEGTETYTANGSKLKSNETSGVKNPDESKEDISLLYQKLGCYKDDMNNQDLKTKVNLKKATQEECAKACALEDKSFAYFGLQAGNSCYCGKNYGKYGKISDDDCNLKCDGNSGENCGGDQSNNIFFFGLGTNYTVKTFTGRKFGAGTDAKIYVEFIGERGSSGFRQLDSRLEKYESGSVDQQAFFLPDLGNLKRMKILHDNTGTAPSWYLDKIQVSDEEGGNFEFPCNDWLSDTQSGGKLERELSVRSIVSSPTW